MKREIGYYWVKRNGHISWEVEVWTGYFWGYHGWTDSYYEEIDENKLVRKA